MFSRETGSRSLLQPPIYRFFSDLSPPPIGTPPVVTVTSRTEIDQDTENKSYGAWLSGTYTLTDAIRLMLGGRWIKDKKSSFLLRDSEALGTFDPRDRFIGCTGSLGI